MAGTTEVRHSVGLIHWPRTSPCWHRATWNKGKEASKTRGCWETDCRTAGDRRISLRAGRWIGGADARAYLSAPISSIALSKRSCAVAVAVGSAAPGDGAGGVSACVARGNDVPMPSTTASKRRLEMEFIDYSLRRHAEVDPSTAAKGDRSNASDFTTWSTAHCRA